MYYTCTWAGVIVTLVGFFLLFLTLQQFPVSWENVIISGVAFKLFNVLRFGVKICQVWLCDIIFSFLTQPVTCSSPLSAFLSCWQFMRRANFYLHYRYMTMHVPTPALQTIRCSANPPRLPAGCHSDGLATGVVFSGCHTPPAR